MIGDNGGPSIDGDGLAKLRYVKINISELLEGIEELTWEQRGYYLTALFKMYARMGGLPFDEREGAKVMRCDIRLYRRMRDGLIACGKFYADNGTIYNARVEYEISEYVREHKRRREAAIERESRKRLPANFSKTSAELPADFSRTSPKSSKEVSKKFSGLEEENPIKSTDAPPQPYHEPTTNHKPLTINHKPVVKKDSPLPPQGGCAENDVVQAFNDWNDLALRCSLPQAMSLTPKRRKSIRARLIEHGGMEAWALALANIERSSFLRGAGERGFRANLDFLVQPSSFAKVVDGVYGNGAHAQQPAWAKNNIREMAKRAARGEPMRTDEETGEILEVEWRQVQ